MADGSKSPAPICPLSIPLPQTWNFHKEILQAIKKGSLSLSTRTRGVGLGCHGISWVLTTLQPALPCQAGGDVQPSTHLGLSLFQADLMKPSLQMKHNFKDRHVVGRSGDDVCLFLLVSSCLFNYRRC